MARIRVGRRSHELWLKHYRSLPSDRRVCQPPPQGRQARRSACDAAGQIRAGHQPQDREGTRPRCARQAARPRRRGDRVSPKIKRRAFISLLGAAAAWPLAARAQQPTIPVIGYLSGATFETMREYVAAFRRGLADEGFFEGRNVAIEYRWTENYDDRLPALATDLVRRSRMPLYWLVYRHSNQISVVIEGCPITHSCSD